MSEKGVIQQKIYVKKTFISKRKQPHSYITWMSMICFHVLISSNTFIMSNINCSKAAKMILQLLPPVLEHTIGHCCNFL